MKFSFIVFHQKSHLQMELKVVNVLLSKVVFFEIHEILDHIYNIICSIKRNLSQLKPEKDVIKVSKSYSKNN